MGRSAIHRKKKYVINKKSKRSNSTSQHRHYKLLKIADPLIRAQYDHKLTVKQNMSKLGLSLNPNESMPVKAPESVAIPMSVVEEAVASGQDLSEAVDAAVEKAEEEARQKKREKSNTELVKQLEEAASQKKEVRRWMTDGSRAFASALVAKYGVDDYAAMAKDHKINYLQHTANQIRRKVLAYLDDVRAWLAVQEEEAEE